LNSCNHQMRKLLVCNGAILRFMERAGVRGFNW
jgi:hypothetical protein